MRTKSDERQQRIIDIATEAFREQGFEHTSMAEIASRVGGSKATLYNYFPSKEALFAQVSVQEASTQLEEAFRHLQPATDLRKALQLFGENFVAKLASPAFIAIRRTVIAESARQGVGPLFYENGPCKGMTRMATFLQEAQENGLLRPCDSKIAATHLRALLEAEIMEPLLFRIVDEFGAEEIAAQVSRALEVFLAAYGAPASQRA